MRVLVACEYSGRVREAFRRRGHDAWSCDLDPSEEHSDFHIQDDVRNYLLREWDLMIAHPPCTYLSSVGAPHMYSRDPQLLRDALAFVRVLLEAPIEKIALENPQGLISTYIRKPDQVINPYEHGENVPKRTCLWLKNLPLLTPTDFVLGKKGKNEFFGHNTEWFDATEYGVERWKHRSRTFQGIANAMALQWG